jgi:tryptophan halogenase
MENKVVILGGGTAGWLTALFINKNWPAADVTVVEDPATPPIIAGESGSAVVNNLFNFIGVNFDDWVVATNAMPKLGGIFTDWNGVGTEFVHGLIPDWYDLQYKNNYPEFARAKDLVSLAVAENIPLENILYNARLQRLNKLPITDSVDPNFRFNLITMPMWHFDSRATADFLKQQGINRNIKLIERKYLKSNLSESGKINSIILDGDLEISANWFFDCSGFSRLLLEKTVGGKLDDMSQYFPAREVVAWWDESPKLINHTKITAMKYGWSWEINLNHRAGNGYIFDSDHITFDQAIQEASARFNKEIQPVAHLKFTPSITKEPWMQNVIAIGLSAGFLEPLESNGLAQVVSQLQHLSEFWSPTEHYNNLLRERYNQEFQKQMEDILCFLALHYRGHRRDTDFWIDHGNNPNRIPPSLMNRLEMFKEGFLGIDDTPSYSLESWCIVAQGLDLINIPKLRERMLAKRDNIFDEFHHSYQYITKEIENICKISYTMEQWREKNYGRN